MNYTEIAKIFAKTLIQEIKSCAKPRLAQQNLLGRVRDFVKYHNAFSVVLVVAIVLTGSAMASEPAREMLVEIVGEEVVVEKGIDNSLLLEADLEGFDLAMTIDAVSEDRDNYYVEFSYDTIGIMDNAWQAMARKEIMTVSKSELKGEDLGLYLTEELGEIADCELVFLREMQEKETEIGVTEIVETTDYSGLIGLVLDVKNKILPNYEPVVKPEIIVQQSVVQQQPAAIVPPAPTPATAPTPEPPADEEPPTESVDEPVVVEDPPITLDSPDSPDNPPADSNPASDPEPPADEEPPADPEPPAETEPLADPEIQTEPPAEPELQADDSPITPIVPDSPDSPDIAELPADPELESEPVCLPDWSCSGWLPLPETIACGETFSQTQTCDDINNCGIDDGKPAEEQETAGTDASMCGTNFCDAVMNLTGECANTCVEGVCSNCVPACVCADGFSDCDNDLTSDLADDSTNGCETPGICE